MKKVLKKIVIFFMITILLLITKNYASSTFSLSASSSSIKKGESTTVTISSEGAIGEIAISVTNGTSNISTGFLQTTTDKIDISVTSTSSEDMVVTVSPGSSGLGDLDENVITDVKSITIKVSSDSNSTSSNGTSSNSGSGSTSSTSSSGSQTTTSKSSVATLSNLGIKPNDFSGFKANTFSYDVEVPYETESVEVYAYKGNENQTVSGTGTKKLNVGLNTVEVQVTAEDGTTKKTYTLNITRKEQSTETNETTEVTTDDNENTTDDENIIDDMENTFGLSDLTIEGYELDSQFQTDVYEYKIDVSNNVDNLNIKVTATQVDSEIEIIGNENFVEGENVVTILVKTSDEENPIAYQIIVNKEAAEVVAENNNNSQVIILSVIVAVILVILIIVIVKKSKRSSDDINSTYIPYGTIINKNDKEETIEENKEDEKEKIINNEDDYENTEDYGETNITKGMFNSDLYKESTFDKKKKKSKGKRFK